MDLFEAHRQGLPLVIETGEDAGGDRLIAELFEHPRGIVYVDTFWPGATSIPFHAVAGEVVRDTDWRVGDWPIRVAFEGESLYDEWQRWQAWRNSPEGRAADSAAALEAARADGRFS